MPGDCDAVERSYRYGQLEALDQRLDQRPPRNCLIKDLRIKRGQQTLSARRKSTLHKKNVSHHNIISGGRDKFNFLEDLGEHPYEESGDSENCSIDSQKANPTNLLNQGQSGTKYASQRKAGSRPWSSQIKPKAESRMLIVDRLQSEQVPHAEAAESEVEGQGTQD